MNQPVFAGVLHEYCVEVTVSGEHFCPHIVTEAVSSNPLPDNTTVCPPAVPPKKYIIWLYMIWLQT
jgi:hypothetical protein